MFNSNKKLILIDYQNSYFYQQKRKKLRRKYYKAILALVLLAMLSVVIVPLARATTDNNESHSQVISATNGLIHGPQLIFEHPDSRQRVALPVDLKAQVKVSGLVAYINITQVFINPYGMPLEGTYQFPLPEDAAIKHLKVNVAGTEIIGEIMEKKAAIARYKKARKQGKKASLVQQQRPNLFTNNIANIPAQSRVVVTLQFIMPVTFDKNQATLRLPLAMTSRYHSKNAQPSPAQENSAIIAPLANALATSQASINIELNAGIEITNINSSSHEIKVQQLSHDTSSYLISLADEEVLADSDFNISWQLQGNDKPQVSSFTEKVADEYFTLLTFFPPQVEATANTFARDIIFIIDTSGSMQGNSMTQAKASLQQAISQLGKNDSFNIIAFDDKVDLLFPKTKMASEHNMGQAQQFIKNLNADGGTEMYRPLSQALVMAKAEQQTQQAIRQVVFITDGAVYNEFELMQLLSGAEQNFRLFTVGIGAAPNGYFMKKAAQFGRGSYVFIQNSTDVQREMSALMAKINHPAISNIELIFDSQVHQDVEVYPKRIADLYLGEPMQIAVKSKLPITSLQVMGNTTTEPWYQQLIIDDSSSANGISTLWARRKIADLLDTLVTGADKRHVKAQVISTSLAHQTLSPYTSFIAVEKKIPQRPLTADDSLLSVKNKLTHLAKAHENLMVAMPKTALGWHQQLLIGLLLIMLAPILLCFAAKRQSHALVSLTAQESK